MPVADLHTLVAPLLGLPYEHFLLPPPAREPNACWGLVKYLLETGLGLHLDADQDQAAQQVYEIWYAEDPRDPLTLVQPWDAYILAVKHPWSDHLGLVVDSQHFVHVRKNTGVCLESMRRWRPKLLQLARLRMLL